METELELAHHLVELVGIKLDKADAEKLVTQFEYAIDDYVRSIPVEIYEDPLYLNGKISSYKTALRGIISLSKDQEAIKNQVKSAIIESNLDTTSSIPQEFINGAKEGNEEIFKLIREI